MIRCGCSLSRSGGPLRASETWFSFANYNEHTEVSATTWNEEPDFKSRLPAPESDCDQTPGVCIYIYIYSYVLLLLLMLASLLWYLHIYNKYKWTPERFAESVRWRGSCRRRRSRSESASELSLRGPLDPISSALGTKHIYIYIERERVRERERDRERCMYMYVYIYIYVCTRTGSCRA